MSIHKTITTYTTLAVICAIGIVAAGLYYVEPLYAYYGSVSLTLFALYMLDKVFAKLNVTRIPEKLLHLFSLAGGFFGGILGMALFTHKKNSNKIVLILILSIAIHLILYIYFFENNLIGVDKL